MRAEACRLHQGCHAFSLSRALRYNKQVKRNIYVALFTLLGLLCQFLAHAIAEMGYITLLDLNYARWSFGFSFGTLLVIHHVISLALLLLGVGLGYHFGKRFWQVLYVEERYGRPFF